MAYVRVYRTYRFMDKDPVIDKVRTVVQDEGLYDKLSQAALLAGVSRTTLDNWFHGDTKRPQHATIAAVVSSLGYEVAFRKESKLDLDNELEHAREWAKREKRLREKNARPAKKKTAK